VEFSASQVRTLKDFFADFFDKPASSSEARALAREAIEALKDLEIELVELHGQKGIYCFLSVLDPVIATLKDGASKNASWFLTDLARAQDALLDTKENIIDPVRRFMNSPQKAIYDQVSQLVAEQEDNFSYVAQAEVDAVRSLLTDNKPWQGNQLQQLKPQLDALQQAVANQLGHEKEVATSRVTELEQRLQATDEYTRLSPANQLTLSKRFGDARQTLQGQKRIAMIRDQLRHFEDERFPQLLLLLDQLARPTEQPATPNTATEQVAASSSGSTSNVVSTARPPTTEPKLVPARTIKVSYMKPWLASEAELDDYLQKQREAWLKEIQAGNRVQI
jgi:hypothetical protein